MKGHTDPAARVEAARAALVREAGIAEEAQAEVLEQLTRVAVAATNATAAFVSFAGEHGPYFRCSTGLRPPFGAGDAPSVVRHLLDRSGPFAIADVRQDAALRGAWEIGMLGAVALLAVPLEVDGIALGTLAVVDSAPRTWSDREHVALIDVARVATHQISLSRVARASAARESESAEQALVESEARYRTLVEHAPDAILVVREGTVAYANPAAVALTGASSAADLVGLPARRLLVPPFLKAIRAAILGGREPSSARAEERLARLDGATLDVEVSALPYLSGEKPAILLILRDVTERKRAEAEIRRQAGQLRLLLDQLPVLVWATDADLRVTSVLGARAGLTPTPDSVGEPMRELFGARDPAAGPLAAQRAALEGRRSTYRVRLDGHAFEVHVEPLRAKEGGPPLGSVGVAMDVTEEAQLADQLREAQNLAALGQFAAGVAHEMNNILGTVLGIASALALARDAPPRARAELEILKDAARRGGEITSSLLGFARKGMYRRGRFHLSDLLTRVADRARAASPLVHVVSAYPPDLPDVEGDAGQVETALFNVCENALDAMPQGGTLSLTARVEESGGLAGPDLGLPEGRWLRIDIADTGSGMTEEVRARAIEPFFTTRAVGRGVGLGLSMAYGVARGHGGDLVLESEPGRGTKVTIFLPAAAPEQPARVPEPARPSTAPAEAGGLVLVVDDDEWVRFSSSRLLEAIGYTVVEASGGAEALEIFRARGDEIVAVLLDLRMPVMDGAEALRRLVALDPDVRVVLCTGYERDQVSQGLFQLGHVGFLGKPFGVKELRAQLDAWARSPRERVVAPGV